VSVCSSVGRFVAKHSEEAFMDRSAWELRDCCEESSGKCEVSIVEWCLTRVCAEAECRA